MIRQKRLIHVFVGMGSISTVVSLILLELYATLSVVALVSAGSALIILLSTYVLLQLENAWLAPRFLIVVTWALLTIVAFYLGGLESPITGTFTVLIVASGLVLGPRWGLATSGVAALMVTVFFAINSSAVNPSASRELLVSRWTIYLSIFSMCGILI